MTGGAVPPEAIPGRVNAPLPLFAAGRSAERDKREDALPCPGLAPRPLVAAHDRLSLGDSRGHRSITVSCFPAILAAHLRLQSAYVWHLASGEGGTG